MAWNHLWTWRRIFTAQYLLVYPVSVAILYFLSLEFRVIFIIINWAFMNAQGCCSSFYSTINLAGSVLFKSQLNRESGNY